MRPTMARPPPELPSTSINIMARAQQHIAPQIHKETSQENSTTQENKPGQNRNKKLTREEWKWGFLLQNTTTKEKDNPMAEATQRYHKHKENTVDNDQIVVKETTTKSKCKDIKCRET
eukprot:4466387-Ditylum_brightwellii.AAC.1